jgi:GNAT superfamily N-acetyltransferase
MAKGFSFEEALKPVEPQGFSFEEAFQPPVETAQQILTPYEQMAPSDGEPSGTNLQDLGKLASASAVKSILGAPEAVQAAGSGLSKDVLFKPTEALNFLADPRQLTNQLAGYVGMKPIFEQKQDAILAKDLVNKQRVALDEALSKGKIQSLREVTKYGSEISKMIEDTVSPEMKEALANTEPTGNVLKALDQKVFGVAAGDTEISFGKAPSAQGLLGQAARVFGSAAPGILTSFITKSATPAAVFGFGQAGGEAVETAREHISKMSDAQLAKDSEYYRNLLVLGYPPKEARAMTEEKAADTAAYYQGIVGALGGAFTGNLVAGKFDATKLLNAKNVLTRIAKGTAVGMTEEGAQELAEGIATDLGINRTVVREMGVDSFANAVLGAIGGGGPGAVSGALSKPSEPPPPPPPPGAAPSPGAVPPDATGQIPPVVPPVTPAAPAVPPAKMAEITADELEEDVPIKKGVTGVTPPAATTFNLPVFDKDNQPTGETDEVNLDPKTLYFENGEVYALGTKFDHPIDNLFDDLPDSPIKQALIEASNKLIADNTKPKEEEPPEEGPLKRLTPAQAALARLKPEFLKEYEDLKLEHKQITAQLLDAANSGRTADPALDARQEEILKRVDELYNDKQYRKSLIEKLPNDPVIEKEALALADELEKVGDTVSSDGLRRNLSNMGGYTDSKKLDYYKGKLLEAQQKAGVAQEMPKDTYSLDNYVRSGNKTEVKRFNEFLPTASAEVKDLVAKSNGYLQAIADIVNSKGYKVADILGSAPPGDMRELRDLLSGIAGSAFSYVKNAEHIAKNNRFANPEKLAQIVKTLENDFVNADKLLGKKVEEPKKAKTQAEINRERQEKYREERAKKIAADKEDFQRRKAEQEKNQQIPEVKVKTIEKIKKNMVRFASGMSGLSDLVNGSFTRAKHKNYGVGFDVGLLSKNAIKELAHFVVNMDTKVFIDSGAFSHFRKQLKGQDVGELDFDKILAKYDAISEAIAEENAAEKTDYPRPLIVMPDVVGDQKASLELVKKYAKWIETEITFNQFEAIIPIQKGELTLSQAFSQIMDDLGTNKFIVGIPSNESAVSRQDLIEFLRESRPNYVHFLGAAADSKIDPLIELVAIYSPGTDVTADASKVRSAILNGVAKGKTRAEAIKDALYEEEDPLVVMNSIGIAEEEKPKEVKKTQAEINRERQAEKKAATEAAKKVEDKKKADEAEMDAQMEAAERGEEAAKPEEKFVTDDEGEKLDFPLLVDMADKGYKVLGFDNPRTYADKGGNKFRTIEKDGVRLAIDARKVLFKQKGKEYGRVQYGIGKEKDVTFEHLEVDPSKRKQGLAKQAIQDLIDVADKNGYTLYLEPAQLENQGMTKEQLSALYSRYGFVATNESGTPMEREPGAKAVPVEVKKTQAEINRERQAEKKAAKEVKPAEEFKVGDYVFYKEPVVQYKGNEPFTAEKTIRAEIKSIKPNGNLELKSSSGYAVKLSSDVTKTKPTQVEEKTVEKRVEAKAEEKKSSTAVVPKVDESWAERRKDVLTEKPSDMSQEVWERYQELQKGNFSFEKVSFTGANALARANAANKERKKVYEKAVDKFLNFPITAKAPTKNQPKLEIGLIGGAFPPPIAKNIKVAKTLDEQKKALLTLAASKDELRVYLKGVLVEPNQLVVTDGHRLAVYKTNTGVTEKTLLDKDGKVIDMQYAPYDRVLDKTKNAKSYGMVNATALGNYIRGISKAWKYISANQHVPFSFQFKNGDTPLHFNGTYIEDMANVFRQFGYEGFEIQYNDGGMLIANSPDNKLTQIVMGTKDNKLFFQPFNVQENRPGIFRTAEEQAKLRKELGLSEESRTIDVEATEITEEQIMLLSDETGKLSKKEMDTLEQYYGFDRDSNDFFKMLREDVIKYVNKGANAVDEAIRSIIAKLQAGVLAVAIVFNPAYMSEPSAVVLPTQTVTQQVMATVPDSAKDMSEGAKKAYAILYPALQKEMEQKNKFFTVVDKPKSKMYVFNPDGSLMAKSNVVLGSALGDVYVGQTQFKQNQITPAGMIKAKAEKGSATYDGKTVYTFGNVKEGWSAVFMHTVYLKEADAEARKKALATGEDTRLSHGCVNGPADFMAKIDNDSMNESHVFIVPDNQAMVDDYIANNVSNEDLTRETVTPVTKTTQVPAKGAKSIGAIDIVGREEEVILPRTKAEINRERQLAKLVQDKLYYNDFTNDFSKEEFDSNALKIREENIKEYAKVRAATRREIRKVAKVGSDINVQRNLNELLAVEEALKDTLDATKVVDNRAIVFRNRANDAEADESLAPEVAAVIDQIYKRYPKILEGLKLSVRENKDPNSKAAGNFNPYNRMVTLWKGSSGVENPSTVRHELVHSLEQMMTPETKKAVVEAWAKSFQAAIKANPDAKSQEFFNKVMDFLEDPSKESFDAATKIMPDYDYYQYMNPSEFWAVNAEKMFAAKLGTPWAKFVNAIKKLFEALKSVFGFNNKYALHKAFDNIINGTLERTNKKEMLTDYLFNGKVKLDFLNSIEKISEENENVPEVPDNDPKSFKEMMIGSYGRVVENASNIAKNPKDNSLKALDKASDAILYTRIKNFFFGAGLEARDFAKYNGAIRTADNIAIASLAVKNVIHAGSISTQVLLQGALEYSADFMQFIAVKRDYSMKNVAKLQYDLRKKLGRKQGDKTIQAYLVASRSRGIYNTYLEAQANMEMAIDNFDNAARSGDEEGRTKAYNEMQEADRALEQAIIAYQKIPTYLRQLDEEGETIYETVEDRKGNEYKLPVLNDEQIDIFINREKDYPQLAEILDNFTAVNHEMIDNMVKSSRISAKEGARLKKMKGYVPWNRVMDEQEELFDNRKIPSMPSSIKYFKKGETDREIGNIIENMNHNVTMMTRSAIRNYAQVRIVQEYARRKENGKLQLYPSEGRFESGVRVPVFIAGQRRIVEIPDAMVAEAILGMITPPYEIPMQKLLGAAAQLVRRTVTFSAYFQLKQVFYDAPTAAWVSGVRNPLAVWTGAFSGFVKAVNPMSNDPVVQIMRSAGIGGFQSYHRTAKKEQDIEFGMVKRSAFAYALKIIDHIGDSSDYAQRIATYNQVFKETGDKALALMQAADVIDFQKHGNGRLAQALRVSVTFMQAYATQLDVLTQAMVGGNIKGQSRLEAAAKFHATGVAMASLMVLWAMMSCGDDDYHELDDDAKARNLYVPYSKKIFGKHILIPLRSTAAMFYKVMPELIYYDLSQKGTKNEMDRTRFWKASGNAAVDMLLGPTPIPSAFKGTIEISLDRNFYTGGNITPDYLKKLEASRQYTASTSELGKIFSAATQIPFTGKDGKDNKRVLSPIQADHLMRSLGGSVATVSMYFTNMVFNSDRPSTQLKENPLLGGLVGADVARRNESLFYDLKERTDKVYGTFQDLIKNDRQRGKEYREANIKMIQAYGYTSAMAQNLSTMNQQIRRLSRSEDLTVAEQAMTPEQKRERINFFNQKKQEILKDVIERRKMAGL